MDDPPTKSAAPRLPHPVRITEQNWPEGTMPVVTIRCTTYQHVNFIRDAIEGFLMQETTFPVEILIHDDASSDGTADIVREYQAKYPQLIRTVLQTENQRSQGVKLHKLINPLVRGEFVALCEGDDYWTYGEKLQSQYECMMSHPKASLCYHRFEVLDEATGSCNLSTADPVKDVSDVLLIRGIQTATMFWRKSSLPETPKWFERVDVGDIPLQLCLADKGEIAMLDVVASVYRKHGGGLTAGKNLQSPSIVRILRRVFLEFDAYSSGRHHTVIQRRLFELHVGAIAEAYRQGQVAEAGWHRLKAIQIFLHCPGVCRLRDVFPRLLLPNFMRAAYFRACVLKNRVLQKIETRRGLNTIR